jgi:hypothetical protein
VLSDQQGSLFVADALFEPKEIEKRCQDIPEQQKALHPDKDQQQRQPPRGVQPQKVLYPQCYEEKQHS